MSPLFTVPETELQPVRALLPKGHYDADFGGVSIQTSEKNKEWRGIRAEFTQIATLAGEAEITGIGEYGVGSPTIKLTDRTESNLYSTEGASATSLEIAARGLVELSQALGLAVSDGNGNLAAPGETAEEVVENLNAARGKRVRFSGKTKPRKRDGAIEKDAKGNARLEFVITHVWDPSAA